MSAVKNRWVRQRPGFTLVELLIVIVIMGVMAMIIGPTFTSGSDVVRIKTASRGVMQMSKYARTMALLHQEPLDLVFTSDGRLSVAQVGGGEESALVSERSFGLTNAAATLAEKKTASEDAPAAVPEKSGAGGGGSSYVMADLAIDQKYEQIAFAFGGYTDSLDDKKSNGSGTGLGDPNEDEKTADETQTFRVRYRSNGTCRPYKVKVSSGGDNDANAITVAIDLLGVAKVEEEE